MKEIMRDVIGKELKCGDDVVIAFYGKTTIKIGRILGFTLNKKARIEVGNSYFLRLPEQLYRIGDIA